MSKQSLTADRWRELIRQQQDSGLSIARFCDRHCVAVSTFFFWRRKLEDLAAPTFVELTPAVEPPVSIQRASESESRLPIELQLRCGTIVRVREGFDVTTLRQVVEALR
jgi:transposase-like protein